MKPIIVIGSGMAGVSLIREVRKLDTQTPLILVTADDGGFYSKPSLSNAFAQNKLPTQLKTLSASQLAEQLSITVLHNTRVEQINTSTQVIKTSMGDFEYRDLVLATGANPIRLPIQGDGGHHIKSINNLNDYTLFREKLDRISASTSSAKIAILGAGLIGCEFADDLNHAGFEVHLIDLNPRPLAALLPEAIANELQNQLENKGVNFHLNRATNRIDRNGDKLMVTLNDESRIEVDMVLSAVGLAPDLSIASQCQPNALQTERGILIDRFGRTSAPHVYALGDCAQYTLDAQGNRSVMPYIAPILIAARAIAKTLTVKKDEDAFTPTPIEFGPMPVIIKTPSCPIAVLPPKMHERASGQWQDETRDDDVMISRFMRDDGSLGGFAMTPNNAKLRAELLSELSNT